MLNRFIPFKNSTKKVLCTLGASLLATLPAQVYAAYPEKPVTIVVPFSPGGAADTLARVLSDELSKKFNQSFIVANKPGAGTLIASQYVAESKPDGYTILLAASSLGTLPSINKETKYDPVKSFTPITQIASVVHIISVNPSLPVHSVKELIDYLKDNKNKNKVNYASLGTGSSTQLEAELFKSMADVEMQEVPYGGSAPALTAMISGEVQVMFDAWASTAPFAKSDKVRVLAVTTDNPSPSIPEMPTISEAVPGFSAMPWLGFVAPANTDSDIVDTLYKATHEVLQKDEVKERLSALGLDIIANDPASFAEFIKKDVETWAEVIRKANLSLKK